MKDCWNIEPGAPRANKKWAFNCQAPVWEFFISEHGCCSGANGSHQDLWLAKKMHWMPSQHSHYSITEWFMGYCTPLKHCCFFQCSKKEFILLETSLFFGVSEVISSCKNISWEKRSIIYGHFYYSQKINVVSEGKTRRFTPTLPTHSLPILYHYNIHVHTCYV